MPSCLILPYSSVQLRDKTTLSPDVSIFVKSYGFSHSVSRSESGGGVVVSAVAGTARAVKPKANAVIAIRHTRANAQSLDLLFVFNIFFFSFILLFF